MDFCAPCPRRLESAQPKRWERRREPAAACCALRWLPAQRLEVAEALSTPSTAPDTDHRARRNATFQVDELLRRCSRFPAWSWFSTATRVWNNQPIKMEPQQVGHFSFKFCNNFPRGEEQKWDDGIHVCRRGGGGGGEHRRVEFSAGLREEGFVNSRRVSNRARRRVYFQALNFMQCALSASRV